MYLKKYDLCYSNLTSKMQVTLYKCVCVNTHTPKAHVREQREKQCLQWGGGG